MGDILFLSHRLPYPPDRGDRIRSWHVLQRLARIAPVHVVAPVDSADDLRHVPVVEGVAASVQAFVRRRSKLGAMAHAVLSGRPASVEMFVDHRVRNAADDALKTHAISTIYAYSSQMAYYVPTALGGRRFVMDFVDMDSAKFAASGGFANRQEGARLLRWETAIARRADVSLFVSKAEADLFAATTGHDAEVLENGIDLDHFAPDTIMPAPGAPRPMILFTGQMDYAPNVEAVCDFVAETLPKIHAVLPGVTFAIVGRAPTPAVRALAGPQVIVTGEVPDTRPWLAAADIVVAPLKLARGVQNKVLEAMASGRPVVASIAAATGIAATNGVELIASDDPAMEILTLLSDPVRAARMGSAARQLMEHRYSWDAQLARLPELIGQ